MEISAIKGGLTLNGKFQKKFLFFFLPKGTSTKTTTDFSAKQVSKIPLSLIGTVGS